MLEVSERLTLGHHAPMLLGEQFVRERNHVRRPERLGHFVQLLHAFEVMFLDRVDAAGHVGERMAVRRKTETDIVERADEIEGREVGVERIPLRGAGDVWSDRWQHVIARQQDTVLRVVQAQVIERMSGRVQHPPLSAGQGDR